MYYEEKDSEFNCLTSFTPTICDLAGVRYPLQNGGTSLQAVLDKAQQKLGNEKIEKILVYAPDACGIHLWERFPEELKEMTAFNDVRVPMKSVLPSVTPVCYASIFSGALPAVHGIQKYEKPVLTVETLFDVFPEAQKNTIIVAKNTCSIDTIFRKRKITYISTINDVDSLAFSELFLNTYPQYDLFISYNVGYDHQGHITEPFSDDAIQAFKTNIANYHRLVELTDKLWANFNRVVIWCPDHGQHRNPETLKGTHGSDMPEDTRIYHFYRFGKKH